MNIFDILIGFVGGGAIGGGALYALQEGKIREERQKYAYREEVAKLQKELEDSQGRLQEIASATPAQAVEVADKTQIQQLEQEYEAKIEELRQSYQSQIQEIIDGKQGEIEALRQSQQAQILELEKGYQWQIQQLEQSYQSQLLGLENARQAVVDDRTTEIVEPWDDFPDSPRDEEINPFDGFITEETLVLEPEFAPETPLETPGSESEFSSEMNPFDGFITEETLVLEPEFAPEMPLETSVFEETFDGLEPAISDWEMSAAEIEFLNSLTLEEETRTIGSLEELSGNYGQIQETVSSDPSFSDLLAPDTEKFADNQNFLDDLFADTADSNNPELFDYFAEETPTVASNRQKVASVASDQEELDFFSMLDNEEMANLESLPSDEELPLDDLFSDDLFSDGDNSKTTRLESHQ